jgi:uncharacterized repeat protein (TIGR03803 family)
MKKFNSMRMVCVAIAFCVATAVFSPAQTFTTLASFAASGGPTGAGTLVQGLNGNFYATTVGGGANQLGTVFEVTPAGTLTTLYTFCSQTNCVDGYYPSNLVAANNGNFYGTTNGGGASNYGSVFFVTPAGKLTTIYNFCALANCVDGAFPQGRLTLAANGNFYGMTGSGGGAYGVGTIFEMTPSGNLTTIYNFCPQTGCADGAGPVGLAQGPNGNFYGATEQGGTQGYGTLFELTPQGVLTTLLTFNFADGDSPLAGPALAANGNFFGTTRFGGNNDGGTIYSLTPAGKFATVFKFTCTVTYCPDGTGPYDVLMPATDGNLYGTTAFGGSTGNYGTIFSLTLTGKLTTLYTFCSQAGCADGVEPLAGLLQATNGNFYGTANTGGANNAGTVFSLSMGLAPFVETRPTSSKVGAKIIILGNNLTGATGVSFNGTAATYTVVSATEITATVPAGATTGTVRVTTPGGTLKSNVAFRVTN